MKKKTRGRLSGSVVEHLTLAQGVILGTRIKSHIGLLAGSLPLPLPMFLPLSVSLMNKLKQYIKKYINSLRYNCKGEKNTEYEVGITNQGGNN